MHLRISPNCRRKQLENTSFKFIRATRTFSDAPARWRIVAAVNLNLVFSSCFLRQLANPQSSGPSGPSLFANQSLLSARAVPRPLPVARDAAPRCDRRAAPLMACTRAGCSRPPTSFPPSSQGRLFRPRTAAVRAAAKPPPAAANNRNVVAELHLPSFHERQDGRGLRRLARGVVCGRV